MKSSIILFAALFATTLSSCGGEERKQPVYYDYGVEEVDSSETEQSDYAKSGEEVVVPFRNDNGIKYVTVKVNGYPFEMIFDTGCSHALISVDEANYLYNKGALSMDDVQGVSQSQIADGSIVENMVVNLREVVINDQIYCKDVTATVSNNSNAPLLLGNVVLDRVASITIDNENETLIFKVK